ncbi:predicted protein [Arabidopsis lyrata subsp. lyrata]|uniref:Predicted protein n=1 Tax=Arabidopsis lyrata subsp. lyrata TaxID=81972 RepID=D7KFV2_ARALL|nr:predicted protein [Arabidopsis lyrata subsp. lyrata]
MRLKSYDGGPGVSLLLFSFSGGEDYPHRCGRGSSLVEYELCSGGFRVEDAMGCFKAP